MEAFTKVVRLGTLSEYHRGRDDYPADVFCKIELTEAGSLSISGVIGPKTNGDAIGGCGQIVMGWTGKDKRYPPASETLKDYAPAPGWDRDKLQRFIEAWDRWHLNDMQAGTPKQQAHLETIRDEFPGYPVSHYEWAKERLAEAGLEPDPDTGYSYGSAWLREDVPADVVEFLKGLPDTDKEPAWV